MSQAKNRKDLHLEAVLEHDMRMHTKTNGLESVDFEHCALPECHLDDIDLQTTFLGHSLAMPFLISSMTGGAKHAEHINANLAEAAAELKIAMGVGSQRISLEESNHTGLGAKIRRLAQGVPLYSNIGAAQLRHENAVEVAHRAVENIEADGLFIHVNPMQEALQAGGDRNWCGILDAIETVVQAVKVPVIVKEVGFGISESVAGQLISAGAQAIDVAGAGGTSWAAVEGYCHRDLKMAKAAELFRDWGNPTAYCLRSIRDAHPEVDLIASGGIQNGLDAAKAIRLGADIVGQAGAVIRAASLSTEAVIEHFEQLRFELMLTCFGTGSRDLTMLKSAPLINL